MKKTVTLIEIEPSGLGEPLQTVRAEVVKVEGKTAHLKHSSGMPRARPWVMPVDRTTGLPLGDWAWRVVAKDLPL